MADLSEEIEELHFNGITLSDLPKIHEKQILGEAIVAEGFSAVADLLWKRALDGYANAIGTLADVNPETEKDKFYRAQRDLKRFADMVRWVNEAIREGKAAKAALDEIEANARKEEDYDDNRQSRYPDD